MGRFRDALAAWCPAVEGEYHLAGIRAGAADSGGGGAARQYQWQLYRSGRFLVAAGYRAGGWRPHDRVGGAGKPGQRAGAADGQGVSGSAAPGAGPGSTAPRPEGGARRPQARGGGAARAAATRDGTVALAGIGGAG